MSERYYKARISMLEEQCSSLRKVLHAYHGDECEIYNFGNCNCGFDAKVASGEKKNA